MICCGGGKTELTQAQTCQEVQNQDIRESLNGFHKPLLEKDLVKHRVVHNIETAILFKKAFSCNQDKKIKSQAPSQIYFGV